MTPDDDAPQLSAILDVLDRKVALRTLATGSTVALGRFEHFCLALDTFVGQYGRMHADFSPEHCIRGLCMLLGTVAGSLGTPPALVHAWMLAAYDVERRERGLPPRDTGHLIV